MHIDSCDCHTPGLGVQQQAPFLEQCSLFLPLWWGAGSMALMLWLNW
jgi:hypothetical protein